jgi:hypothetical protein
MMDSDRRTRTSMKQIPYPTKTAPIWNRSYLSHVDVLGGWNMTNEKLTFSPSILTVLNTGG